MGRNNIYFSGSETNHNHVVLGIYYRNGVFEEDAFHSGISYVLDHILYSALAESIEDKGFGRIRVITQYGYTSVLIISDPQNAQNNLSSAISILTQMDLPYDVEEIGAWIDFKRQSARGMKMGNDVLYYAKRIPRTPLAKPLSAALNKIPSNDALNKWREKYVNAASLHIFFTDNTTEQLCMDSVITKPDGALPQFSGCPTDVGSHTRWKRSFVTISVPYCFSSDDVLPAEILCRYMNPLLSNVANRVGARLDAVQIHPDYLPEWQIRIRCFRGNQSELCKEIWDVISATEITEQKLETAAQSVMQSYRWLAADPEGWNLFAGYNALSGRRYDLPKLVGEEMNQLEVIIDSISDLLEKVRNAKGYNVYIAPLR